MSASSQASDKLCETCSEIIVYIPRRIIHFNDFQGSRQLLREYHSLEDVAEGAKFGCAFCTLLHACHVRSAGPSPATVCTSLKVYRVTRGDEIDTSFIKLECDHAYGWHSEQCLGIVPIVEGNIPISCVVN